MIDRLQFPRRPLIMGIVNVNDDSFSGDGSLDTSEIVQQCRAQICAGADVIDLGAESARTNRAPITEEEEIARLLPVLAHWPQIVAEATPRDATQVFPPILSINTWRPAVVRAVLQADCGVGLINDMSALAYPETLALMAQSDASLLIMHSVGLPKQDHSHVSWEDIMAELHRFFTEKVAVAEAAGIPRQRLVLDPGLDFAKTSQDSQRIIKRAGELAAYGSPVLMPLSRKQFIGDAIAEERPAQRDAGTIACLPFLMDLPAVLVRVHNVPATWQSLALLESMHTPG